MSESQEVIEKKIIDNLATSENSRKEVEQRSAASEYGKLANNEESVRVKVHSPYRVYYEGLAFSVSAVNETGPFDILPKHHNFICLLQPCELVIRTLKYGLQRININGGLMHVKTDSVSVLLDI